MTVTKKVSTTFHIVVEDIHDEKWEFTMSKQDAEELVRELKVALDMAYEAPEPVKPHSSLVEWTRGRVHELLAPETNKLHRIKALRDLLPEFFGLKDAKEMVEKYFIAPGPGLF